MFYVAVMEPELEDVFGLYQRCLTGVVECLQKQMRVKVRRCVYTAPVVIWLMIVQRLQARRTLAGGVEALLSGVADPLLSGCERARKKQISRRTGGYSHARQRLSGLLCRQVTAELITRLREIVNPSGENNSSGGHRAYVLDGSSLELEADARLLKIYPPSENQQGKAHWPVLRMVVLHELATGLAEQPQWGAMYGPAAVSEQQLTNQAIALLMPGSIVIGDRNFGVFSVAWEAGGRRLDVIIRLTNERARKVAAGAISQEGEQSVVWKASRFDGRRQGGMPKDAVISGRLISVRIGRGQSQEWLHLFTTTTLPRTEVVALYGQRWNIETDLRALKRTVGMHHITARSQSMMEKELLAAIAAYNLVRTVIALAAHRHNLAPRQLSFTFALTVVNAAWPRILAAPDERTHRREVLKMLDATVEGKHPQRKRHRSFPRAVWYSNRSFPHNHAAREVI
jgi:hypothetical protein